MSEDILHPLESILRLIASAAPEPWYPRLFAKQEGVDRQELSYSLEELYLSGLIEKEKGDDDRGPAISLTREGERVLLEPEALQRLRDGEPLSVHDRAAIIRRMLSGRNRPLVTRLLVVLNLLVFGLGYYYADNMGAGNDFLRGSVTAPVVIVLERCGMLSPRALLDEQWWRLLTAGFVHVGFLNVLMNVVALFFAGRFVEQLWGRLPYLTIYLAAMLGGSCLGVAHGDGPIIGATGGLCGLFAAEVIWFLFNKRYLPREFRRQARTNAIISVLMLALILYFTNINPWSDIGGAAGGAMAAFLLHLHRYGPSLWRWLALVGFVPLVWYGHDALDKARAANPAWHKAEKEVFRDRYRRQILDAADKAADVYDDEVSPILEMHPTRRDPAKVEKALTATVERLRDSNAVVEDLTHAGPFGDAAVESARQAGLQYTMATAVLFAECERILRLGDKRTDKDKRSLQQQGQMVLQRRSEWEKYMNP